MVCGACGVGFGGTGNCDCTTDGKPNIGFWRRLAKQRPVPGGAQTIRQAELMLMKLENKCNVCGLAVVYPLARHSACDEAEMKREALAELESAKEYKKLADQYVQEYQIDYDVETMSPQERRLKPKYSLPPDFDDRLAGYMNPQPEKPEKKRRAIPAPGPFKRYAFGEDV